VDDSEIIFKCCFYRVLMLCLNMVDLNLHELNIGDLNLRSLNIVDRIK